MAEVTTLPHSATSSAASTVRGKRDRGTPTKQTPQQPKKRVSLRERERSLGCEQSVSTRLPLFPPIDRTPHRPKKRVSLREREHSVGCEQSVSTRLPLFPPKSACTWSLEEVKSLVEFVLFHADPIEKWPSHKRDEFWDSAARFVQRRSRATLRRTGKGIVMDNFLCLYQVLTYCRFGLP